MEEGSYLQHKILSSIIQSAQIKKENKLRNSSVSFLFKNRVNGGRREMQIWQWGPLRGGTEELGGAKYYLTF